MLLALFFLGGELIHGFAIALIIGVGGAKLVYAWLADRASLLFKNTQAVRGINMLAGGVMIAVGMFLLAKTQPWI